MKVTRYAAALLVLTACGSTDHDNSVHSLNSGLDNDSGFCGTTPEAAPDATPDVPEAGPEAASDAPIDPRSLTGEWGPVVSLPIVPIHMIQLPPTPDASQGRLLFFADSPGVGPKYLYNIETGEVLTTPNNPENFFCAGHTSLADGRALVLGGGVGVPGTPVAILFDPFTNLWNTLPQMAFRRWYGTGTTLGDGRVFTLSGQQAGVSFTTPEILDISVPKWTTLTQAGIDTPLYPFVFQLPDGRVMAAGASEGPMQTKALDLKTNTWTTLDPANVDGASIRMYANRKWLKVGAGADNGDYTPSKNTAYKLDLATGTTWQPTANMAFARSYVNLTGLPDGTVLATGGGTDKSSEIEDKCVKPAELWNEATGTWTQLAAMQTCRMYHSQAILLPDGRVWVGGQGGWAPVVDHKNYEIFSPPYLFKGPRPTITSVPSVLPYWVNVHVDTPDTNIEKVVLVRFQATTHSFDESGRSVFVNFTPDATGLTMITPLNGNTAPPGYYMLFLVNSAGVPSMAKFVKLDLNAGEVSDAGPDAIAEAGDEITPEPVVEAGPPEPTPEPVVEAGPDVVDAGSDAVADASSDAEAGVSRVLIGDLTQSSAQDSMPSGGIEAFKYAASLTGDATKLAIYIRTANRATKVGLYSHNATSNQPQTLLASISFTSVVGWNIVAIPPTTVTAAANYWIAVLTTNGASNFVVKNANSGLGSLSTGTGLTALPATFPTTGLSRWTTSGMSAYARE